MNAFDKIQLHTARVHEFASTDKRGDSRISFIEDGQSFYKQIESFAVFFVRKSHAVDDFEEQRRISQPLQIFCQAVVKINYVRLANRIDFCAANNLRRNMIEHLQRAR